MVEVCGQHFSDGGGWVEMDGGFEQKREIGWKYTDVMGEPTRAQLGCVGPVL